MTTLISGGLDVMGWPTAAGETEKHTDDEVIDTATYPGNFRVSEVSHAEVKDGVPYGLSGNGTYLGYREGIDPLGEPIDTMAALIQLCLMDGTTLAGLVGSRVGERLPAGFENTQAALVVMRTTGGRDPYENLDEPIITFQCYGGSARRVDADAVARALIELFDRQYSVNITGYGHLVRGEVVTQYDWVDVDFDPAAPVSVVMMRLLVGE